MANRVTFYIDGFNFYYGLKRTKKAHPQWGNYYWIDIVKLCESFLSGEQQLEKVVYFTASPLNPEKDSRQSAFLYANALINEGRFEIVRGKYLEKTIVCPYCKAAISRPEEKKTDVNISVRMMADCVLDRTDTIVLVSADLRDNMTHHSGKPVLMLKNEHRFQRAIMPDVVEKDGHRYEIPEKWKLFG